MSAVTRLIAGFVRECTHTVPLSPLVPLDILHLIVAYQKPTDRWNSNYCSKSVAICKAQMTIKILDDSLATVYGNMTVKRGDVYTWKLRIVKLCCDAFSAAPYIGLIMDKADILEEQQDDCAFDSYGYQYCGGSGYLFGVSERSYRNFSARFHKSNDVIELTVDMNQMTIEIKLNESESRVAFQRIQNTAYRLALSVTGCSGSVFKLL